MKPVRTNIHGLDVIMRHDYIGEMNNLQKYIKFSVEFIDNFIKKNKHDIKSVLCVGCGDGYEVKLFKDLGYICVGIDAFPVEDYGLVHGIDIFKASFSNFSDLTGKNSWDLVFVNHSHEHTPNAYGLTHEISKVLKKGGLVFDDVPYANDDWGWSISHSTTHFSLFTPPFMRTMFERYGFETKYIDLHEMIPVRNPRCREIIYIGQYTGEVPEEYKGFIGTMEGYNNE